VPNPLPTNFADRLTEQVRRRRTAVLVGLDPRWEQLPTPLTAGGAADTSSRAATYARFCREVIDVVAPLVPAVKPQAAFFEQLGPAGMAALFEVIQHARAAGLIVIIDGKRNDIGSTAEAYAEAYLGSAADVDPTGSALPQTSAWGGDALTVSPYLGDDSLRPFVDLGQRHGNGVFVLVKTSNPGGGQFQDLVVDGRPLYRHVGDFVERLAVETTGQCGYGAVGAVVGATYPQQLAELRQAMPHTWFLVPGYGAQGGAARDVAPAFDAQGLGAVVNSSRGIIFAHARKDFAGRFAPADWQRAVEAATREMIDQLRADTPAGKLG
jgi:orotidine-5'-phosphate decarboxylase